MIESAQTLHHYADLPLKTTSVLNIAFRSNELFTQLNHEGIEHGYRDQNRIQT